MRQRGKAMWLAASAIALAAVSAGATVVAGRMTRARAALKAPPVYTAAVLNHRLLASYATVPVGFEPNLGQTSRQVKFLSHRAGYTLFLTPAEAVIAMREPGIGAMQGPSISPKPRRPAVFRISLKGAAQAPQFIGIDRLPGKSNYFIGNDPKKWVTGVPAFAAVELKQVYPGIALIYHSSSGGHLEYDFRLAPGADPNAIRLSFGGAAKLTVDRHGSLTVRVADRKLAELAPKIFQETANGEKIVAGGWKLRGPHEAGFRVASYDRSRPLVIDPTLVYSTYLGGAASDTGYGIAVDSAGFVYVAGAASSLDFPTTASALKSSLTGTGNAFVAKLNPALSGASSLLYSTYLGGNGGDTGYGIAVDSSGNVYVTGQATSTDFPVMNAFQSSCPSASSPTGCAAAFMSKLNPSLSGAASLVYSTYLGGSVLGQGNGIAIDSSGDAYVTGMTQSTDFPAKNAFQSTCPSLAGGCISAFVTELNPATSGTSSLVYSTYLGGSGGDIGQGIAIGLSGNAYVTGVTESTDFPTKNAYQSACPSAADGCDAGFVTKLNPAISGTGALIYSTYLGGGTADLGKGIAVDSAGDAYVIGTSQSSDFPTLHAFQSGLGSPQGNAFVAKLNPAASGAASLLYSTYLGGSGADTGGGIAVDSAGDAYVTGTTTSLDFPILYELQASCPSQDYGCNAAFIAKLNPAASGAASLIYSTYLGGSTYEQGGGIAVDSAGHVYVTGQTQSFDFPTTPNAFQTVLGGASGSGNAFVSELSSTPGETPTTTPSPTATVSPTVTATASPTLTATPTATVSPTATATPTKTATPSPTETTSPTATLTATVTASPTTTTSPTQTTTATATTTPTPVPVILKITPKRVNFPATTVSTPSKPKNVTISNPKGSKKKPGIQVLVNGASDGAQFEVTNNCPAALLAGAKCTIAVTFMPTAAGLQTGTLTIEDNASENPQTVPLKGTGK
ncbi:MAG: SBBP repeat-containing protein [Candidatus Binataceae bacterium]